MIQIRAMAEPWNTGIALRIISSPIINEGQYSIVKPSGIEFEAHIPGSMTEPSLRIDISEAQILMDDLWNAGIRPTEGTGSAGSLKATENHLSDMRSIVESAMGIELNPGRDK